MTESTRGALHIAVFVTSWGTPSETFVRREVETAIAAGHKVTIVSLRRPIGPVPSAAELVHLPPWHLVRMALQAGLVRPLRVARHLLHVCRRSSQRNLHRHLASAIHGLAVSTRLRGRVDVAHAHFAWLAATSADSCAVVSSIPLSIFVHAFDVYEEWRIDDYLRSKLERAAVVAVESPTMARFLTERYSCTPQVVRIGVPRSWLREEDSRSRGQRPVILSVGMLREKKGHDLLLRAVASMGDDVQLEIAGDGPLRDELAALADQLGVAERTTFRGLLSSSEVRSALDQADVFVLASRRDPSGDSDGLPNVLIEAMARRVPVVSTRISGIPDLLGDGCGVLVDPDDVDALVESIGGLLEDPRAAEALASRGFERIKNEYVAETNWHTLERLLCLSLQEA